MAVQTIIDDDNQFLEWRSQFPSCFVVNAYRKPTKSYLKLHTVSCGTFRPPYTKLYSKTVGDTAEELLVWAREQTGYKGSFEDSSCPFLKRARPAAKGLLDDYAALNEENEPQLEANDQREAVVQAIKLRRGQAVFRNRLIEAYDGKCVVTGCEVLAVLEAAHIKPYRGLKDNAVQNGLLLRADIHTLFDLNLLAINPATQTVELDES
ncbi:MAG: HNH endonuclease, partial [Prosthecobacter sp.]